MSNSYKTNNVHTYSFRKLFSALLLLSLGFSGTAFSQDTAPENQSALKEVRELRSVVMELQQLLERQNETIRQLQQEHESSQENEALLPDKDDHGHKNQAHDPDSLSAHEHADESISNEGIEGGHHLTLGNGHEIDVSAVLDFTYFNTDNSDELRRNKFDLRELELGFQGWLTDRVRVDLFLTKPSDEVFDIEEGFFTLKLDHGFKVKAGKYRLEFGKLNTIHETARPFVDLPLPLLNFLGEGQLNDTGVTIGHLLPNPWGHEIGLSGTLSNGENEASFNGGTSTDTLVSGRLYDLMQLDQSSDLEIGLNFATGANDEGGRNRTTLGLMDLTYRYNTDYASEYDYPARFMWQSEALFSHREGVTQQVDTIRKFDRGDAMLTSRGGESYDVDSFGYYSLVDYQFRHAWHVGLRYDDSESPEVAKSDKSLSTILTWFYSEHSKFRLQYQFFDPAIGEPENRIWLQAVIILGKHKHPKFIEKK